MLRRLIGAGVDFVAMTANTPHMVFDELAAASSVPLLSIVEVCAAEAKRRGLRRLLLLGTRFTMQAEFYPTVFARYDIDVVAPDRGARVGSRALCGRAAQAISRRNARQTVALITRLRDRAHVDGIILGGTELPLLRARSSPTFPSWTPRTCT
jgi:aspartate racemase